MVRVAAHKRNHLDPQTSLDSAHILCKYAVLQAHILCKWAHILCKQLTNIRSGSHALHIERITSEINALLQLLWKLSLPYRFSAAAG
jgi:hypothetical protein